MAVNIKTPVVVENITLMCLRILQKLIKPPAPTSKKNKVRGESEGKAGWRPPPAPASTVSCLVKVSAVPCTSHAHGGAPVPPLPWFSRQELGFLRRKVFQRKVRRKINVKI